MRTTLILGRLFVALVCFVIGILFFSAREYWGAVLKVEPISIESSALRVSACELSEPTGKFVGKRVSVRALVYYVAWKNGIASEDFIYVHPLGGEDCSAIPEFVPFIYTELDLHKYSGPRSNLKFELGAFEREVEVRIVGIVKRMDRSDSEIRYSIEPENVELISPLREFTPKGAG